MLLPQSWWVKFAIPLGQHTRQFLRFGPLLHKSAHLTGRLWGLFLVTTKKHGDIGVSHNGGYPNSWIFLKWNILSKWMIYWVHVDIKSFRFKSQYAVVPMYFEYSPNLRFRLKGPMGMATKKGNTFRLSSFGPEKPSILEANFEPHPEIYIISMYHYDSLCLSLYIYPHFSH